MCKHLGRTGYFNLVLHCRQWGNIKWKASMTGSAYHVCVTYVIIVSPCCNPRIVMALCSKVSLVGCSNNPLQIKQIILNGYQTGLGVRL